MEKALAAGGGEVGGVEWRRGRGVELD